MSHTSMILSALMTMAMLVFIAPNVFALNRGHILRNIALWLGIFIGLALIYQNFGPDSPHPLFQLPDAMSGMQRTPAENRQPVAAPHHDSGSETSAVKDGAVKDSTAKDSPRNKNDDTKDGDKESDDQDFTPPKE